jgi:hypothetical protein
MAKARRKRVGRNGRRKRNQGQEHEQLKILRLDLNTIMEQLKLLEDELEADPCLSTSTIEMILSLAASLKQDLEGTRIRIRELKHPAPA